jgi:predicted amidohydrolase YtcJ
MRPLIVLTALLIAACGDSAPPEVVPPQAADLVIVNANGYTMTDSGLLRFATLVVDDGRVVAVGDSALAEQWAGTETRDVDGTTILPGLTDAHGHVSSLGALRRSLDLAGLASLDATLTRIADYERRLADDSAWVLGRGWNQVLWPGQAFPTAADLDTVVPERPVFLNRIDGHAAWANSRALELAGITADTADPDGGRILRDDDGTPTGVLVDAAMHIVEAVIPPASAQAQRENLRLAMVELASLGVTSVHDAGASPLEISLYQSLADAGAMPIRVSAMLGGIAALDAFDAPIRAYGDDRLDVTSVKLYEDGALGSRGAAMIQPYSDDPGNKGLLFLSAPELADQIRLAYAKGFGANVHAIGDLANRATLDAFESLQDVRPDGINNRIEHAQVIALDDIPRFATLDIVASIQPTHATSDMNMAEDRVGAERIRGAYAWRRLLESGARIAAGSDFPVEKPEMFDGLYAAVTRQDKSGRPKAGWYPDQALTREETLAAFSLWAADSVGQADRLGSLEPGKWADFILVDRDYFTIPPAEIWQIDVLETWVGGRPVAASR